MTISDEILEDAKYVLTYYEKIFTHLTHYGNYLEVQNHRDFDYNLDSGFPLKPIESYVSLFTKDSKKAFELLGKLYYY